MKTKSTILCAMSIASLAIVNEVHANLVTVRFSAVIENSPFAASGYAVGDVLRGWYLYDTAAAPLSSGNNFTMYPVEGGRLSFRGAAEYTTSVGRLDLVHLLPGISLDPVDAFDLFGFSLSGPSVDGFSPGAFHLNMTDTDNLVYSSLTTPYPIDFPDADLFEVKTLLVTFLRPSSEGEPVAVQTVKARVGRIGVPDTDSTLVLFAGGLGLLVLPMCARQQLRRGTVSKSDPLSR